MSFNEYHNVSGGYAKMVKPEIERAGKMFRGWEFSDEELKLCIKIGIAVLDFVEKRGESWRLVASNVRDNLLFLQSYERERNGCIVSPSGTQVSSDDVVVFLDSISLEFSLFTNQLRGEIVAAKNTESIKSCNPYCQKRGECHVTDKDF